MAGYDNNKLGELRPNQIITTFGPGAIVDAVKDSVTVLDINYWKERARKLLTEGWLPILALIAFICLVLHILEMCR